MTDPAALTPVKMEDATCAIDPSALGSKKGVPWSEEEHRAFLKGLEHLGKGNWRSISRRFVLTRSPTQVASHAQKYFLRLNGCTKRRSRFAVLEQAPGSPSSPKSGKVSSSPMMYASPNIKATWTPAAHGQLSGSAGAIPSHTCMYPPVMLALPSSSGPTTFLPPMIMATATPSSMGQCFTWPAWPAADGKVHEHGNQSGVGASFISIS